MWNFFANNPSVIFTAAMALLRGGWSGWEWFTKIREQKRCALAAFAAVVSLLCAADQAAASIRDNRDDNQPALNEQLLRVASCQVSAVLNSCVVVLAPSAIASQLAPQVDRISSHQQQLRDYVRLKEGKAKRRALGQADSALRNIIEAARRAHALLWEQIVGEPPGDPSLPMARMP